MHIQQTFVEGTDDLFKPPDLTGSLHPKEWLVSVASSGHRQRQHALWPERRTGYPPKLLMVTYSRPSCGPITRPCGPAAQQRSMIVHLEQVMTGTAHGLGKASDLFAPELQA